MLKQYFKQAWRLLKENPVLSAISIIGTALAICMIMVMVMSHQVKNAPYPPETNRDRMLYVNYMKVIMKNNKGQASGGISSKLIKECFKPLQTAEIVAMVAHSYPALATIPASNKARNYDRMFTDETFWKVFDFSFIAGKPYTKEDVDAALHKVVISERVAREIFNSTDVVGKTILLDYHDYMVCGVVKDVSLLARAAYSQIWLPYTLKNMDMDDMRGQYSAYILAHSKSDFPKIKEEAEVLRNKYNASLASDREVDYMEQPDTQFAYNHRTGSSEAPDLKRSVIQYAITILLLLLVPAVNLSSMTGSRMRKRLSELGVRRAFGATHRNLFSQILWESMMQTLVGGLLGLALSFFASYLLKDMIYGFNAYRLGNASIDFGALFKPATFVYALLFCMVLNVLSSFVPAWRISRKQIVNAIHSN
ncbi:MAG: FtsX-like permease family protein [Proteiniphilum sp.]|uniref:ABC transporter permease n=1 Tax=Proteiniphilum sp. TaxID=1926877 RepID=UPI002B1E951F|nr:FtsX-like permease family protein [Proteiniphilum sp.]MEA5128644.1 FtsX-like permease family protein [Proteiniphilum sp.]